jgi:CelD/BcsL family acetyltransferase involved in cellulose biosynthesis
MNSVLHRNVGFSMARVLEISEIERLAPFLPAWRNLLLQTVGASFFQSPDWLEAYWRHFGEGQRLRVLVVLDEDRPTGIVPLVVRRESTSVGSVRTMTFPLHDWGSFYGPIGPDPAAALSVALAHLRDTPRDWDILELRWQGAPGTDPRQTQRAMLASGFQAYPTVWDETSLVELDGNWESYWAGRKGAWRRRFRHAELKLAAMGDVTHVRYRPLGQPYDDGAPRWDLYNTCERIAKQSWQGESTDGTTLSHESIRGFLRDVHEAAAAQGAVDLNLLLIDRQPVAFVYGYHYQGYIYGLRRGHDAECCREGAGNVLLACVLRDSFSRGDRVYDMGVGSPECKRHFQTRRAPIVRYSHFPPLALRMQALRLRRWWQGRRAPASIAVGRIQDNTTDPR